jgi:hypothetical protein
VDRHAVTTQKIFEGDNSHVKAAISSSRINRGLISIRRNLNSTPLELGAGFLSLLEK